MHKLTVLLLLSVLITIALADFTLLRRSRGYKESTDFLSLKIKNTNCDSLLKEGGLASRIKGGQSHHCLPITGKGADSDILNFVGRCLNHDKDSILSIVEVKKKKTEENKTKAVVTRDLVAEPSENKRNVEFYLSLRATDVPVDYEVLSFSLEGGHVHQVRRPNCIKARNHCLKKKSEHKQTSHIVIDCEKTSDVSGHVDAGDVVYLEVTRRETRADTCKDPKNENCCKYVNAHPVGGICTLYTIASERPEETPAPTEAPTEEPTEAPTEKPTKAPEKQKEGYDEEFESDPVVENKKTNLETKVSFPKVEGETDSKEDEEKKRNPEEGEANDKEVELDIFEEDEEQMEKKAEEVANEENDKKKNVVPEKVEMLSLKQVIERSNLVSIMH